MYNFLTIWDTEYQKIRLGKDWDGGYVIAKGLTYDIFISAGIADDISFEKDFCNIYNNIKCIAFDGTIENLPTTDVHNITFIKKNITGYNTETTTNFYDILESYTNIFLKMDIETFEYQWLDSVPDDFLLHINQLVIEFHFPFTMNQNIWDDFKNNIYHSVETKVECLKRLSNLFYLVHMHPNTCCGTSMFDGHLVPNVLECTYIRKDLCKNVHVTRTSIPTPLDMKNNPNSSDIILRSYPYCMYPDTQVTILGSCRQHPIRNWLNVTSIQDSLDYPHYSKEILQEIKYLKYHNIPIEDTKYIFRNGLLSNCKEPISNELFTTLQSEFFATDIFLVEIASRIDYKWRTYHLHHIAKDDSSYQFPYSDEIDVTLLSDEEIFSDLIEIKNELYPKPFIVISHFATYEHGRRYELIQFLKLACQILNIPFFDQSTIVSKYGNSVLQDNAHFSNYGNNIVGSILYDKIVECLFI